MFGSTSVDKPDWLLATEWFIDYLAFLNVAGESRIPCEMEGVVRQVSVLSSFLSYWDKCVRACVCVCVRVWAFL